MKTTLKQKFKEKESKGEIEVCIYESYLRTVFKPPVSAK